MPTAQVQPPPLPTSRERILAGVVSLAAGTAIFLAKLVAWWLTRSSALLSDALESTVNVVAASFALWALRFSAEPADREHPYGHGKAEHLSAAFEGGLITLAAGLIGFEAIQAIIRGPELRSLDTGLFVAGAAALGNLVVGRWLVARGRRFDSPTLMADGKHVLSDVWTTGGVLVGLLLVRLTGFALLDPILALGVAVMLARTGVRLTRTASGALVDREDPELLRRVCAAFETVDVEGLSQLHRVRALRHGDLIHVDAHAFAPAHWRIQDGHAAVESLAERVSRELGTHVEFALHLDPFAAAGTGDTRRVTVESSVRAEASPSAAEHERKDRR